MQRQTFRTGAWRLVVAAVLCVFVGLLIPATALTGDRPFGLGITVLMPVVMLPLAALCVYYGLIRRLRIDLDRTGVTVTRGPRRLALPWAGIRAIGVVPEGTRGQRATVVVIRPTAGPTASPVPFDTTLGAYIVVQLAHLAASQEELAAAVELAAPGTWHNQP